MSKAVEAEIIEPEEASELTVAYSPAVIEANFDALEAHVRRLVADYEGATYDMGKDENVKAAKRDRAYLNGIAKEIDERRKAVSREYTKPLAAFEDRCKAVAGSAKQAADGIKAQLDEAEEERQLRAYAKLREHYEEFAGLLAPVVPYERFHEKQWTNKTFGEVKAFKALEAKVERLAQAWETLKAQFQGEPFYDEAERELFATLDLGAAITAAHKAGEERRRIAELKAAEMIVVEGTLYPILTRQKNAGLLTYRWEESPQGPPRKYYTLTEKGREYLTTLDEAWDELVGQIRIIRHGKQ